MSRCNEIKKLNNLPKNKYIYQRHKGMITKYIQKEGYYIDCATGIGTKIEEHLLLGKISYNLIDLIECGDYVNGYKVMNVINEEPCPNGKCVDIDSSKDSSECTLWEEDIQTILTKESYMANCYKVGEEDE